MGERSYTTRDGGKQAYLSEFAADTPADDPGPTLDALTDHQREVYDAVVNGDRDIREYAEEIGESVGAVAELAANARDEVEHD